MTDEKSSIWMQVLKWLQAHACGPGTWPPELPPETAKDFWWTAVRQEMAHRTILSEKVRLIVGGQEPISMNPIEGWLYHRRVEWAAQIALGSAKRAPFAPIPLKEALLWALVESWETDGCIAMWKHAERGGKPHPENPDGLTPLAGS